MSLDDPYKLREAEAYLLKYSPDSQEFDAALEHVEFLCKDPATKNSAKAVIRRVVTARSDEQRFREKMKAIKLRP